MELNTPTPAPGALPKLRVLVVDDNVDAADTLAALLRGLGQSVRQAYDGRTALIVGAQFRPDVAFVDVVMPGMDGHDVAAALRDMSGTHATRIIAMTGYGGEKLKEMTAAECFDANLVKPASLKDLTAVLAST
jgi:CheY-like chemotaxis protein